MPFSFNPGQPTTSASGAPAQAPVSAPTTPGVVTPQAPTAPSPAKGGAPSVPDSPFLFISQRNQNKEISVTAYLQIILMVVAILSILASLVLFAYGMYLSSSIQSKKDELALKDASFPTYPIAEMRSLSNRFSILGKILSEYVSPRATTAYLEKVVENQAVFNDFRFSKNFNTSASAIDFIIVTNNYRILIQQLEALNLKQYSKVIPKTTPDGLTDGLSVIKIKVNAPIKVEGKTAKEVEDFLLIAAASSTNILTASTTP
jgi:hypothetical protein